MAPNGLELTHVPSMQTGMLVRRPPSDVFRALVDPAMTTRFWFTKSSGELAPDARVRWQWEMYGAATDVHVLKFERDRRLVFEWGDPDGPTTVEVRFTPWGDGATNVEVDESGFRGDGDAMVAAVAGSAGGFTIMLCSLKAFLEHDLELGAVADRFPEDRAP